MTKLIGTAPNQVPTNGMLGTAAFMDAGQFPISKPVQAALDGKQAKDADLTAIAGLAGTSGLLKKTAADTWELAALVAADIPSLDASKITSGTVANARLPASTTSAAGIVQLNDTLTSTSTSLALTAAQGKVLKDTVDGKQATLVSGTNIKTINGASLLGSGNIDTHFPAGTAMLFQQTTAPTGWTKSTTHDNKALRVVSGTAGSGGTVAFTTAFASKSVAGSVTTTVNSTTATGTISGTVGDTTLTEAQIPAHTHKTQIGVVNGGTAGGISIFGANAAGGGQVTDSGTGGGGSHNHSFSGSFTGSSHTHTASSTFSGTAIDLAVQYVDLIIATKD